uniref:ATP-dependent DNA helicase n=1 Tax=Nicotiana tabacum TaxID=4097 RepID=A0A1S3YBP1_TOBAC|nr:PREDICTED: uncharacterized protein LOC107774493 [Nicotiana tabacum]
MREFFAYRIQERKDEVPTILSSGRLFQQFLVDGYAMLESSRLKFIRTYQKQLRVDSYKVLADAILHGDIDPSSQGKRIILPSSFTGGARYMVQNYQDAMTICKWAGYPDLFITFTCNPKWPEITRFVESRDLNYEDRPDILKTELTDDELKNRCLKKLDIIFKGCGKSFNDFPTMPRSYYNEEEFYGANRLINEELRPRFAIPLNPTEDSTCNIKKGSPLTKLIVKAKLIIWDEAPMMHKYYFEALDKTLRDILRFKDPSNLDHSFGGKTIILGSDFRQILFVITKGTRQDVMPPNWDGT